MGSELRDLRYNVWPGVVEKIMSFIVFVGSEKTPLSASMDLGRAYSQSGSQFAGCQLALLAQSRTASGQLIGHAQTGHACLGKALPCTATKALLIEDAGDLVRWMGVK